MRYVACGSCDADNFIFDSGLKALKKVAGKREALDIDYSKTAADDEDECYDEDGDDGEDDDNDDDDDDGCVIC